MGLQLLYKNKATVNKAYSVSLSSHFKIVFLELLAITCCTCNTGRMLIPPPVSTSALNVPFYSQFHDIDSSTWQKVGCGITSLAMVIDYYIPNAVSVNTLLLKGIALGAYDTHAGWIHQGLLNVAKEYNLDGFSYDVSSLKEKAAIAELESYVNTGPVIVSIHYKFNPKSSIPHLVVITGKVGDTFYYNDPAATTGEKKISVSDFSKGWKKKFIVVRPMTEKSTT